MIGKCFVGNRWILLEKYGYSPLKQGDMFLYLHEKSFTSGAHLNDFNNDPTPEMTIIEVLSNLEKTYTEPLVSMFNNHIAIFQKYNTPEVHAKIMRWSKLIVDCINNGHKVLIAGNGGSAADAQHFAAELVVRLKKNRRGIPALALTTDTSVLTAIANDFGMIRMFSRQIEAFGEQGDVFIAITTSGNSENILEAVESANSNLLDVIVLTGKCGGEVKNLVAPEEIFVVSDMETARIQEFHEFILHAIAEMVENTFPETAVP